MRLGPVGMALTARLDHFYVSDDAIPANYWDRYQLDCIRRGEVYSIRDEYGRFHSTFTSLSKSLRKHLRTKTDDQLTTIDITNCQPLLLGIVASRQSPSPYCDTLTAWLDLTQQGEIYEYAADKLTEITGRKWGREDAKGKFLPFMFDQLWRMRRHDLWKVFEKDFPSILDCIRRIKSERYQALSHQLFILETEILLDGVAATFMRSRPDAPILTIHDELIVPSQYSDEVREIIETDFEKYGVKPSVKVETQENKGTN